MADAHDHMPYMLHRAAHRVHTPSPHPATHPAWISTCPIDDQQHLTAARHAGLRGLLTSEFHHWLVSDHSAGSVPTPDSANTVFKPAASEQTLQLGPKEVGAWVHGCMGVCLFGYPSSCLFGYPSSFLFGYPSSCCSCGRHVAGDHGAMNHKHESCHWPCHSHRHHTQAPILLGTHPHTWGHTPITP